MKIANAGMTPRGQTLQIRGVDLFCGVGGLTHGLEQAGINVVAGFDIDRECKYAYEANNSALFVERDVNDLTAEEIQTHLQGSQVSLIAGCAPCQPYSSYSRTRKADSDSDEWQLVVAFGRLVRAVQPDLVSMENVPQLVNHGVFNELLGCLEGYSINWQIVGVNQIGVPQTRKRLVLLASKFGTEGLRLLETDEGTPTVRDAIGKLPAIGAGEVDKTDPIHRSPRLSEVNLRRIQNSKPGGSWRDWPEELLASCHKKDSGATYPSVYGRMSWDEPSPTITTQCFGYGNGRFGHPEQDRAISLREAALLQSFPADYKFVPPNEAVRFSVLGRLIGNAVPVRLGEVVGKVLISHTAHYLDGNGLP